MVGKREKETADTGIEASLTGHLVLSTLHTNSAVETITSIGHGLRLLPVSPMPCWGAGSAVSTAHLQRLQRGLSTLQGRI